MRQELRVVAGLSHKNKFLKEAERAEAHEIEVDKRIEMLKHQKHRLAHEVQLEESAARESQALAAEKLQRESDDLQRQAQRASASGKGARSSNHPQQSHAKAPSERDIVQKEIEEVLRAADEQQRQRAKHSPP
eukprot:CAMPEP_0173392968 /NCGR_PEP_ID=MMETSP1356-20130122/21837_1 /TAXON_ID=77927 ORGANISM="Hemiselmis virescens, Strain PCC157" /NCGR_SAMPLE_ID=MMETSP1356 /ASSEMBLY_ACC=CAM_ASM_000847 /LENGTH=132 /DNA_ID=CAMNT_0014350911 /DNA_START=62 /DNA_END=457 /DNA_ORIENTATION=-